ncbi:creatininase family protein [Saccharopolyspora shandongensis]|uniref:creatininase family protein n=1 Tax=Saccharopolyspora shandongensis TaxID=418495 RepID=UPI0034324AF7
MPRRNCPTGSVPFYCAKEINGVHPLPTTTAVDEQRRKADVALLPVGSFEQHGAHLPLATDSMIAHIIATRLCDAYDLLLLPPITISCSHEHEGLLAGTVSIRATTLHAAITDISASLDRQGIRRLALISGPRRQLHPVEHRAGSFRTQVAANNRLPRQQRLANRPPGRRL